MISMFSLLISFFMAHATAPQKPVEAKPEDNALLLEVEEKYQNAQGISMTAQKSDHSEVMDQTRRYTGSMKIKKGKFRLDLQTDDASKDQSMVIADGKNIWLVILPPKDFKEAKTQVMKASMSNKRAKNLGLLQILTEGGILKHFQITGVVRDPKQVSFYLDPKSKDNDIRSVTLFVNSVDKTFEIIRYTDALKNETVFEFSKIDFKSPISDSLLKYTPPKNAEVTTY